LKKWISIAGIIVIIAVAYLYHQPKPMDFTYESVIYSNESDFEKQTIVKLKGNYYRNLFGKNVWIGELVADVDLRYEVKLEKMDRTKYFSILTRNEPKGHLTTIGSVMTSKNFDKVWLQLDDINEKYNIIEGYIGGPAGNKYEGNDVASKIIKGE